MSFSGNGIYVVRGEVSTMITAMRRGSRWNLLVYTEENKDSLTKLFVDLKLKLNLIDDLRQIDPNEYLLPFLEVIRTDETTGVVTSLALTAIKKFLSYGLIDINSQNIAVIVENIVESVTHARFMGTDQSSDGVTLFRVVDVLHTLMRSPEGSSLTNEAVCEIMLSCFKICFEPRINELLRRSAEQALKDMVLLIFMKLPKFSEDRYKGCSLKKCQIMTSSKEQENKHSKTYFTSRIVPINLRNTEADLEIANNSKLLGTAEKANIPQSPSVLNASHLKGFPLATTTTPQVGNILDMKGNITQSSKNLYNLEKEIQNFSEQCINFQRYDLKMTSDVLVNDEVPKTDEEKESLPNHSQTVIETVTDFESNEYINSVGVRFTQQNSTSNSENKEYLLPYGMPCVQELFRFLILLSNPLDKQNTDAMLHLGLTLLTVAFEVGADDIGKYDILLSLVKDDLCRNLIALLNCERVTIFAVNLQLCFLLFESLRDHLKFQLEEYLKKLSEIIVGDNPKMLYEIREIALENLMQLWRIPAFVTELYINYDCDIYCTDIFENLANLLSKYTLSATNAVYSTHVIALDTLISVIENIEKNCIATKNLQSFRSDKDAYFDYSTVPDDGRTLNSDHSKDNTINETNSKFIYCSKRLRPCSLQNVPREYLVKVKQKKRILTHGTDLFNQRPDKGIQYLQENGILKKNLNPMEIALFLRENPGLDKKMIGEYISKKKNVDSKILLNFVNSFDFVGLRIDQALRLYLETFRLPGEAPLIFLVLEHFADHWHTQNGEPFANTDAAFSLAYAIIMLNMDQHNSNAKRLNVPMTQEDFLKNLRGLNGGSEFDQDMLINVFNAIKNEEIVMPAEQTGLVRENYLWKVLLRRGIGTNGVFHHVEGCEYDLDVFNVVWGASLSALSFMFDKSSETGYSRILSGFAKSAGISAHYNLYKGFDALILTLCKFTTLLSAAQQEDGTTIGNDILTAVNFGLNAKAQASMKTIFMLVHEYGNCFRDGWKNILDIISQLFRLKLLPKSLIEVDDFCEASGKTELIIERPNQKQEVGLFSSLYSYLSSEGQREPSYEEQEFIKISRKCIRECHLEQMIQESKFLQFESLEELLKSVLALLKEPKAHKSMNISYSEEIVVFWMEFLVKIVFHNRDRMMPLWPNVRDQMYLLLEGAASCGYEYLLNRSIIAVLKLAIYLMRNEELCSIVLQSLKTLLLLKPDVIFRISNQISIGIYELLKTSAQNIHSEQDWKIIFTILECVGAGAIQTQPNDCVHVSKIEAVNYEDDVSVMDRGYSSDSQFFSKPQKQQLENHSTKINNQCTSSPTTDNWILVSKETDISSASRPQSPRILAFQTNPNSQLIFKCTLNNHSPFALFKCWDSLAFIVRNVAHITPYNFDSCVHCIRTFVEASCNGCTPKTLRNEGISSIKSSQKIKNINKRKGIETIAEDLFNEAEHDNIAQRYETLSIQLLDLMYTLYTRTAQIFRWWAEEGCSVPQCSALWEQGWQPLLQGIARLAIDRRREVRTYAISCLQQRALLVHDLQTLSGAEWASCFKQVLFPLLNELLPESSFIEHLDIELLEESRIRVATIMSKVFLHHLSPLIELKVGFNDLWMEVLDYIYKFMRVGSDMLSEQMQEILKNMLLVMHSVRVFHMDDNTVNLQLWELTWRRIGEFLPNLKNELFQEGDNSTQVMSLMENSYHSDLKLPNNIQLPEKSMELPFDSITNQLVISDQILKQQNVPHGYRHHSIESPCSVSNGLTSTILPDLVNNTSEAIEKFASIKGQVDESIYENTNNTIMYNNEHSFLIEVPDSYNNKVPESYVTGPFAVQYENSSNMENNSLPTFFNSTQTTTSLPTVTIFQKCDNNLHDLTLEQQSKTEKHCATIVEHTQQQ